jgi:hypothetical protein
MTVATRCSLTAVHCPLSTALPTGSLPGNEKRPRWNSPRRPILPRYPLCFPVSQDGGHDAGITARVDHRDNPQGLFLGCIGAQVFMDKNEPQRPRSQVRPPVSLMGKSHETAKGVKYLGHDPVGRVRVFLGKVNSECRRGRRRLPGEARSRYLCGRLRCASVFAFRRAKASSPSMSFAPPLFSSS